MKDGYQYQEKSKENRRMKNFRLAIHGLEFLAKSDKLTQYDDS
jgi:hypothetical protein